VLHFSSFCFTERSDFGKPSPNQPSSHLYYTYLSLAELLLVNLCRVESNGFLISRLSRLLDSTKLPLHSIRNLQLYPHDVSILCEF
jgi:hypothetical protein